MRLPYALRRLSRDGGGGVLLDERRMDEEAMIRVVLIDDHQSFIDAIRVLLKSIDRQITVVDVVTDPSKASEIVEQARPDIVLLDMRFPADDGLTVLLRLNELDDPPEDHYLVLIERG